MLVRSWAEVGPADWRLVIAGPDDNGHRRELELLADSLGIRDSVEFRGPAYEAEKWSLLANADLFVLPSFTENFGIVVAEAMAAGVPVITTTGTPWSMLQEHAVGWWVAPTVPAITIALRAALASPAADLAAMGQRAHARAAREFTWKQIAHSLHAAYRWAIAGGEKPPCIRIP